MLPVDQSAVEGQSVNILFAMRQKSTYTVTELGGRIDEVEIIGNETLIVWRVAFADVDVDKPVLQAMMLEIQFTKL